MIDALATSPPARLPGFANKQSSAMIANASPRPRAGVRDGILEWTASHAFTSVQQPDLASVYNYILQELSMYAIIKIIAVLSIETIAVVGLFLKSSNMRPANSNLPFILIQYDLSMVKSGITISKNGQKPI
jgi:hypothetical protein